MGTIKGTSFDRMVSLDNLFSTWKTFRRGKGNKREVQCFERDLEDHLFELHEDLVSLKYWHGSYHHFRVFEPKERYISKASVRDRFVHQLVYQALVRLVDKTFMFHSLSCREGKGIHLGIDLLQGMMRKVSHNGKRPFYALKMDIRRFFDSIDHEILKGLLLKRVRDERLLWLVGEVIDSFYCSSKSDPQSGREDDIENASKGVRGGLVTRPNWGSALAPVARRKGLPLGNVTSHLLANLYLDSLDRFVKEDLKQKYYIRYADDFVLLSHSREELNGHIARVRGFLGEKLGVALHPDKILLMKGGQGIDFLGYVLFLHHRELRTKSARRMKRRLEGRHGEYREGKISSLEMECTLQSYLGMVSHMDGYWLGKRLQNQYWVRSPE